MLSGNPFRMIDVDSASGVLVVLTDLVEGERIVTFMPDINIKWINKYCFDASDATMVFVAFRYADEF